MAEPTPRDLLARILDGWDAGKDNDDILAALRAWLIDQSRQASAVLDDGVEDPVWHRGFRHAVDATLTWLGDRPAPRPPEPVEPCMECGHDRRRWHSIDSACIHPDPDRHICSCMSFRPEPSPGAWASLHPRPPEPDGTAALVERELDMHDLLSDGTCGCGDYLPADRGRGQTFNGHLAAALAAPAAPTDAEAS